MIFADKKNELFTVGKYANLQNDNCHCFVHAKTESPEGFGAFF